LAQFVVADLGAFGQAAAGGCDGLGDFALGNDVVIHYGGDAV